MPAAQLHCFPSLVLDGHAIGPEILRITRRGIRLKVGNFNAYRYSSCDCYIWCSICHKGRLEQSRGTSQDLSGCSGLSRPSSSCGCEIPIRIHLEFASDHTTVSVSNGISVVQAERYKAFVEPLNQGEAADLLLKQQEEIARSSESAISSLGLLTMITDYDAQLDRRFDIHPTQSESMIVTTSAVLTLKNVSGASA
jgi:hypothetical protein